MGPDDDIDEDLIFGFGNELGADDKEKDLGVGGSGIDVGGDVKEKDLIFGFPEKIGLWSDGACSNNGAVFLWPNFPKYFIINNYNHNKFYQNIPICLSSFTTGSQSGMIGSLRLGVTFKFK